MVKIVHRKSKVFVTCSISSNVFAVRFFYSVRTICPSSNFQISSQMCVTLHKCEDKFHHCFAWLFFMRWCRMRQARLTGCLCPTAAGGRGWWWTPGPVWPGSRPCRPPRWGVWRSRGPGRSSGCLHPAVPTWAPLSPPELRTSWWQCSPPGLKPDTKKK